MENQLQLSRILVFVGDFKHARRFASHILRKQLHTKSRTDLRELIHLAFNTSLVISYSRPFGRNYELDKTWSSLEYCVGTVLTTQEELQLHEKVLELRDTAYGHSDATSHLLPGIDYNGKWLKIMEDAFVPLTESDLLSRS